MTKPIVFMFGGQGSHYYQMGRELFEQQSVFKHWMQSADRLYQEVTGLSMIETLYDEMHQKTEPFTRTLLTHPAIFAVQYALGQVLLEQGIQPDCVLGTSLGEFAAAVFAGVLTFETALIAVIRQAQLLEDKCPSAGMLAILSSPELYEKNLFLQEKTTLAANNFPSHFIVSGNIDDLMALETELSKRSINSQRLAVSHGFHSPLIEAACTDFQKMMSQQLIRIPIIPFISCAQANSLMTLSTSQFWDSIRLPIQFQASIKKLETDNHYYYVDVGPSGTLATFVKYNLSPTSFSQPIALLTPFATRQYEALWALKLFGKTIKLA